MGVKNSSATRVWPVFLSLIQRDPSGTAWLPTILESAASEGSAYAAELSRLREPIEQSLTTILKVPRRIPYLNVPGFLPKCFEYRATAPERFLLWLLDNAGTKALPRPENRRLSAGREALFAGSADAKCEARTQLLTKGGEPGHGRWWVLEGETSIDCFLETRSVVLVIEGKRTDDLSKRTDWFPKRHQLVRNLEVAQTLARGKRYAALVIYEGKPGVPAGPGRDLDDLLKEGAPHLSESERHFLGEHYLGRLTWKDVCDATKLRLNLERDFNDNEHVRKWFDEKGYVSRQSSPL